ncbi:hypothetical protein [Streptomyces sp. ISL-100]|uniref:hypothetical protein n=1 Tax=Streptomyces sp. ISL-100 TaxID=2819173 RepID=UPI001BEC42F2|nr:hypothetical protein [Streptomyces sp. ISL-100]MBT2397736.1 hypothetical protein [Streptomyces sp. ISL-100]
MIMTNRLFQWDMYPARAVVAAQRVGPWLKELEALDEPRFGPVAQPRLCGRAAPGTAEMVGSRSELVMNRR